MMAFYFCYEVNAILRQLIDLPGKIVALIVVLAILSVPLWSVLQLWAYVYFRNDW